MPLGFQSHYLQFEFCQYLFIIILFATETCISHLLVVSPLAHLSSCSAANSNTLC